jgi:hypothetical protein
VTGRKDIRCKQLEDYIKERSGYWNLRKQAPDRTVWRTGF